MRGEVGGDVGSDAGEVDDQRSRLRGLEDAAVASEHLLDVRGVGDHHRDDVRLASRIGDVVGAAAAALDQLLDLLRRSVHADDVEAGVDQVAGHGCAHDSQADERNGCHDSPLSQVKLSTLAPLGLYSRPT